jgi:hypothetical protein
MKAPVTFAGRDQQPETVWAVIPLFTEAIMNLYMANRRKNHVKKAKNTVKP